MTEPTQTVGFRENASAGHLSVHVEGQHPVDVPFMFEQPSKRIAPAALASFVSHVLIVLAVILFIRYAPKQTTTAAFLPDQPNANIIWLQQPGPGGGGGGGGNRMKEPPRKAELPGKDKITVPVAKPPKLETTQVKNEPPLLNPVNIPAKILASAQDTLPGAIEAPPGPAPGRTRSRLQHHRAHVYPSLTAASQKSEVSTKQRPGRDCSRRAFRLSVLLTSDFELLTCQRQYIPPIPPPPGIAGASFF